MKLPVTAAILCIALIFTAAFCNFRALDRFIDDCNACIDDGEAAALPTLWESRRPWLEAVIHHELLRSAEDAMTEYLSAAEGDDPEELARTAALFQTALYHIREMEKLSPGNIL